MGRWKLLVVLCSGFAMPAPSWAGDPDLVKTAALQNVLQKVIVKAEPSIACILVCRSEAYTDLDPGCYDKNYPGRLGSFDPELLRKPTAEKAAYYRKLLDLANPKYVPQAFGSGVAVDASGLVLTNYHVVQDATKVYVRLPGGKGSYADIHAADPRSDLAVLRLLNPEALPLRPIALGDADKLERGQFVLTLANPYAAGFRDGQPSASWGILSNIRRRSLLHLREEERIKPLHYYSTLLQTDARLSLGCSGGALLNLRGEMVGLLSSVAAIQGGETPGGFAIPVSPAIRRIVGVLCRGEEVEYGFLGVNVEDRVASALPGIPLATVGDGTPAQVDGKLKQGDIIVAINGQPVRDSDDIFTMIGVQLAGTKMKLHVRDRDRLGDRIAHVTLAKLYVPGKKIASSLGSRPFFRGLRVDYTSVLSQQRLSPQAMLPGVYVSELQSGSAAEHADLKVGAVIVQVNQRTVNSPAAFYRAVANAVGPVELALYNFKHPPIRVQLK